jgi:hypothetical protein
MNTATLRGLEARIDWGYFPAVRLGSWTVTVDATHRTLTGRVTESDTFRVQQQPLTFVVSRPRGNWLFPVNTLQIADGQLTASLGPQE